MDSGNDKSFQSLHEIVNEIYKQKKVKVLPSFLFKRGDRSEVYGGDKVKVGI